MVVDRRLLLAVASAFALVLTASVPMLGATKQAQPSPLRAQPHVRVRAIAAQQVGRDRVVAVGWHEGRKPRRLYLTFSRDGGVTYTRNSGKMRRFPVVGVPALGMSMDVCAGRIWIGSAFRRASDTPGDSDVFLTSRRPGGGAAQALMTSSSKRRRVRDVSVACAGNDLLAIAWLEKRGRKERARLMLRSLERLGTAPRYKRIFNLGSADLGRGLAVAATSNFAGVAWVQRGELKLKRFRISNAIPPAVDALAMTSVAVGGSDPVLAALSQRLVVAYTLNGKVKLRVSDDLGTVLGKPRKVVRTGNTTNPSRPFSIDVVGKRIVLEAGAWDHRKGRLVPHRIQSVNSGAEWSSRAYGHTGSRMGALLRGPGKTSRLMEAWHNNAAKGRNDTLRARYELP